MKKVMQGCVPSPVTPLWLTFACGHLGSQEFRGYELITTFSKAQPCNVNGGERMTVKLERVGWMAK